LNRHFTPEKKDEWQISTGKLVNIISYQENGNANHNEMVFTTVPKIEKADLAEC
jgi:hypothetical protein